MTVRRITIHLRTASGLPPCGEKHRGKMFFANNAERITDERELVTCGACRLSREFADPNAPQYPLILKGSGYSEATDGPVLEISPRHTYRGRGRFNGANLFIKDLDGIKSISLTRNALALLRNGIEVILDGSNGRKV